MSRNAQLRGQQIELTAIFLDAAGDYADPTNLKMSVYPPGKNPENENTTLSDAWVYNVTTTDPGSGPYASLEEIEKIDTGRFKYTFTVPADADLGAAYDRWEGTVDLQDLDETFTFTIVGGGSVGTTALYDNNMVFVQLDENIAATDGDTLGDDYTFYFTTTYDPLYSTVRRIRLELGPFIEEVPDDTINLAIFEASLEADALTFGPISLTGNALQFFNFARRQYVTCVTELILLGAITSDSGGGGAKSKRLADLSITYSNNADDVLKKAAACRAKWEAILTSVGVLGPGTSQKPSMVIKGIYEPDRPDFGREWEPTSTYGGIDAQMPAANTRSKESTKRRWKRDYYGNSGSRWGSRFDFED